MSKDTQQQKKLRILLIGDSCTDVYVMGNCNRLSSEAPVPVFLKKMKAYRDGMSSNVFQNMSNMSEADIVHLSNDKKKIKKIRFIDAKSKQQVLRYDIENEIEPLSDLDLPNEIFDAVVISDYDKGFLTESNISKIVSKYDCKIFVDSKKRDLSIFSGCTVKINEQEELLATGKDKVDLIVTLGVCGCRANNKTYPTDKVEVHDVVGAGDVFLSSLVCRWLETKDIEKSIMTANKCASHSVTKMGTYHLSRSEYENLRV